MTIKPRKALIFTQKEIWDYNVAGRTRMLFITGSFLEKFMLQERMRNYAR
jgi:hypothetical protein